MLGKKKENAVHVCVYASSSKQTPDKYLQAAAALGKLIAEQNMVCINGGGAHGAMGGLNRGALEAGGEIIGVLHEKMVDGSGTQELKDLAARAGDSSRLSLVTARGDSLEERKQVLMEHADCFIALPGGPGTWEVSKRSIGFLSMGFLTNHYRRKYGTLPAMSHSHISSGPAAGQGQSSC